MKSEIFSFIEYCEFVSFRKILCQYNVKIYLYPQFSNILSHNLKGEIVFYIRTS